MGERRRFSTYRGRRLTHREALLERLAMRGLFDRYLKNIPPRVDPLLIRATTGRVSATGINRVGLVTTTGAKSGRLRAHPMVLLTDGDDLLAIGAHFGLPTHPAWAHNLRAHPDCDVIFRGRRGRFRAHALEGAAYDDAWATWLDFYPGFMLYEQRAAPRVMQIFRLQPVGRADS